MFKRAFFTGEKNFIDISPPNGVDALVRLAVWHGVRVSGLGVDHPGPHGNSVLPSHVGAQAQVVEGGQASHGHG